MLKIKLSPQGKKHQISYRIVVTEAKSKINGRYTALLGFYNPQTKTLKIDQNEMKSWQKKGAQITTGLDKLLNPDKYPDKPRKKKKKKKKDAQSTPKTKTDNKKVVKSPEKTPEEEKTKNFIKL